MSNGLKDQIDTAIFFLVKKQNSWELSNSEIIPVFYQNKASLTVDSALTLSGNYKQWKHAIQAFHNSFKKHQRLLNSNEELFYNHLSPLAYCYFSTRYPKDKSISFTQKQKGLDIHVPYVPPVKEDTTVYQIVQFPPVPPIPIDSILKQLTQHITKNHPEFRKQGINGKAYASIFLDKEGKVYHIKLLRPFHNLSPQEIKHFLDTLPHWKPAHLQQNKPVKFEYRIPIKINT